MHKRIIAAVLLGTFVFVACVLNVAPNEGQSSEIEVKNEEIATENKRGISSVIEDSLENNNISGKTKHIEEVVKEPPVVEETKVQQEGWTTENLNVREQPNTDSGILDTIPFNTYIKYYEYNDDWAEISFDNGQAYISRDYISDEECDFVMYDIPKYEGFKSWMSYKAITNKSSKQYKLQQIASTGLGGVRVVDNRMCVAIGTAFNADIGAYVDLILEDGFIIPCIVADIKSSKHTDSSNVFTIVGKSKRTICCTEFVVDLNKLDDKAKKTGDMSYVNDNWNKRVVNIIIYSKNIWEV